MSKKIELRCLHWEGDYKFGELWVDDKLIASTRIELLEQYACRYMDPIPEPKRFFASELIKYFNDRKEILFKKHDSSVSSLSLESRISELDQAIAWVELQTNER